MDITSNTFIGIQRLSERTVHSVCVCVAIIISVQGACVLYCLWPAPLHIIVPHYLKNGTIFGEQLLNIKYVF
jgi:hypothetical protein